MFGDIMGMMAKVKETQAKLKQVKNQLADKVITVRSAQDNVVVELYGNGLIKDIAINQSHHLEQPVLNEILVDTLNRAIQMVKLEEEKVLSSIAKEGIPNIPGLEALFK